MRCLHIFYLFSTQTKIKGTNFKIYADFQKYVPNIFFKSLIISSDEEWGCFNKQQVQ